MECDIKNIPFETLEIFMSQKTSYVQKRTAFKVLQRYFRNFKTEDKCLGVNLDDLKELDALQSKSMSEAILELKKKGLSLEAQNSRLRRSAEELEKKLAKKNEDIIK